MKSLMINDNKAAYKDVGTGTVVVLAHCSSASHKEWSSLIEELKQNFRVLAPDLLGYGESEPWTANKQYKAFDDISIIEQLIKTSDEPVHIVAHSYGGAMALEAARLNKDRIRSMTLIEPVSFHLLRHEGHFVELCQVKDLTSRIIKATEQNDLNKAAKIFMTYWIGFLKWVFMPAKMKKAIISTMRKVSAECATLDNNYAKPADYRAIDAPVNLILGTQTTQAAKAVTEILSSTLKNSRVHSLTGAGHMSPFTHKAQITKLVLDHIQRYERKTPVRNKLKQLKIGEVYG